MKSRPYLGATAILLTACAAGWLSASTSAQVSTPAMSATKWEYKVFSGEDLAILGDPRIVKNGQGGFYHVATEKALNELGKDGWELTAAPNRSGDYFLFFLKRAVPLQK